MDAAPWNIAQRRHICTLMRCSGLTINPVLYSYS
jgi:hypothetical protein